MNTMSEYYLKKNNIAGLHLTGKKQFKQRRKKNHLDGLNDEDVTTWIRVRKVMQH